MKNDHVKLRQADKGKLLYHYTKSNGINGIMTSNCFWATKSDFLNDPNEFLHIKEIVYSVCEDYIPDKEMRKNFIEDILEENVIVTGGGNREYFVLSFSNCPDSITMWSEFGAKTGYNISFESDKIVKRIQESNIIDYHGFVIYNREVQERIIWEILRDILPKCFHMLFHEILKLGRKNRKDPIYQKACEKFQKIAAVYAMFFKDEAFAQEEEYRFIFEKQLDTQVHFREKDGFMIPYIEVQLSQQRLPVMGIVVAPQNHIDLAKKGMEYMSHSQGYEVEVSLSNIKLRY
ncbi:MAG: DUF2971 domain-containing protein [Anaerostipes sp.]|nr:DUF2971 domain-containing protein [Anaerostipes sp.]